MKRTPLLCLLSTLTMSSVSCIRSVMMPAETVTLYTQSGSTDATGNSADSITIFLLERDIPPVIKRLGIINVAIDPGKSRVDKTVKTELRKNGKKVGANGSYRINEGYYPTNTQSSFYVPYLLFRYE
ncbi:hypothetical protein [Fibrella aquatica]|uniref:hypothetical protein n=1 Tax=Fibrella aquatica TaxID=3242487 RepID=UPI0035215958